MDARNLLDALLDAPTAAIDLPAAAGPAFSCQKFILQHLLDRAGTVVPTRDVMPVLKNVRIEVAPGRLRITATDMELALIATTELVDVTRPGVAVIPARRLQDIIREAGDHPTTIDVNAGTAAITIGRTTWRLRLDPGDDYPAAPDIGDIVMAPVERDLFLRALGTVRYAICKDPGRLSLNMVDVRAGRLTASDGVRFQQVSIGEFPFDFQLPVGAVPYLLKLLAKTDVEEIHIGQTQTKLIFRFGSDVFIANKLMAHFPDLDATFLRPALANRHPLTVDKGELVTAIRRVRINADTNTSAIALRLGRNRVTVTARDMYGNEANEDIEANWEGPERTIVLNHVFLTDVIGTHGGGTVTLFLGDDTRTRKAPVLMRGSETGAIGVVQQMRADWVGA